MDSKDLNNGSPNINDSSNNGLANSGASLFFSRTEFMYFLDDVEVNICLINNICEQLEKLLKIIGTSKDSAKFRERIHLIYRKTNARIRNTGEDFECLLTVFQNDDCQQELSLENIQNTYCRVIKKYEFLQQRIVLAARQSDEQFWDTFKLNPQNGAKTDEECDKEEVGGHQLQLEREYMLLQRQSILQKIETDILDLHRMINLVSGLVDDESSQGDSFHRNNFDTASRLEEGYKDSIQKVKCCHRFSCIWFILVLIAMILVVILTICLAV